MDRACYSWNIFLVEVEMPSTLTMEPAYYLSYLQDVKSYPSIQQVRSKKVRDVNKVKFEAWGLRGRLLARQELQQVGMLILVVMILFLISFHYELLRSI